MYTFLYFLLFRSHWDVWCFWKSRHLESFLPFLVSQMARPKKPPGKTLTQWRIDDDIHDMWSENHMDIKLAFVVLLFFGLQHFNTQSWSNTVYLWKWSIWENYPFGLQYAKNTWSLLHVHGVQIGKDGALNMNLTLIQNRQWDSTTKSWTKDLLHRRTGYHNLWVLKLLILTQGRCIHAMIGMTLMKVWSPWFFATFDLDGPGSRWPWRCGSCAAAQIRPDKDVCFTDGVDPQKTSLYTLKPLKCFFLTKEGQCVSGSCAVYTSISEHSRGGTAQRMQRWKHWKFGSLERSSLWQD